ncbi:MAG: peptidylprolyl isomerase, partial [Gemmatimonadota bacterium]|nr:peptidylprolyl isomerase [Gemmatimonadota bacterium]
MTNRVRVLGIIAATAGGVSGCGPAPLAEAGREALTVDEAATLIADHSSLPADTQVVRVVAELWVDYTLLHQASAADTSLAGLDVSLAIRQALDQIALKRLATEAVAVDSVISEEELRARFAADLPGARATASQILLAFPGGATGTQRDSVRRHAAALRDRAAAGEDFASLAARYSSDPGSGRFGGSMGTFERGLMLPAIDQAVFSLQVGEISQPVETEIGVHVLRVDALQIPDFDEAGATYRARVLEERRVEAEERFREQVTAEQRLNLTADAVDVARALARAPGATVGSEALRRRLATYRDGSYTVADLRPLIQSSPPALLDALANGSDETVAELLLDLASQRMLVRHASDRGLSATEAEADSVATEARAIIRDLARQIGLLSDRPDSLDSPGPAPADPVTDALRRIVAGEQEIIPLA